MHEELAVTPKSGVLHFRCAYLCVQSSQAMLGKLSHQSSDFDICCCNCLEYIKGQRVLLKYQESQRH